MLLWLLIRRNKKLSCRREAARAPCHLKIVSSQFQSVRRFVIIAYVKRRALSVQINRDMVDHCLDPTPAGTVSLGSLEASL